MSYILEALRKSEKERKQDEIPTLQHISAPRQAFPTRRKSSSSRLSLGLSVLVLLLAVALGFLIQRTWFSEAPLKQEQIHAQSELLPETPQKKATQNISRTTSDLDEKITEEPVNASPKIVSEPSPLRLPQENDTALVINRQDSDTIPPTNLPLPVQENLNNMQFAGHAYSQNRALRLIMINKKILHEGDPIDADFRLAEITENGVVLLYHSKRIALNLF